jgi:Icc-related predicted phosphoesterase
VIRVAAVGDVHVGVDSAGELRTHWRHIPEQSDLFLIAGDLTRHGEPAEAAVAAGELRDLGVPTIAVLGNHDYESGCQDEVRRVVEDAGVRVLEGESTAVEVNGARVGIAGSMGFGGGFVGACATDFGEPEMKAFIRHTIAIADRLHDAVAGLEADLRLVLLHYSPVEQTLQGERLEIYPFLGSYHLADAIDRAGADLVLHGHAHAGTEKGVTSGGVPVRNVAQPVIGGAYKLYRVGAGQDPLHEP